MRVTPVVEEIEGLSRTSGRDAHGFLIASRMLDAGLETRALKWLHEHESLPLHTASACPMDDGQSLTAGEGVTTPLLGGEQTPNDLAGFVWSLRGCEFPTEIASELDGSWQSASLRDVQGRRNDGSWFGNIEHAGTVESGLYRCRIGDEMTWIFIVVSTSSKPEASNPNEALFVGTGPVPEGIRMAANGDVRNATGA